MGKCRAPKRGGKKAEWEKVTSVTETTNNHSIGAERDLLASWLMEFPAMADIVQHTAGGSILAPGGGSKDVEDYRLGKATSPVVIFTSLGFVEPEDYIKL